MSTTDEMIKARNKLERDINKKINAFLKEYGHKIHEIRVDDNISDVTSMSGKKMFSSNLRINLEI